MADAVSGTFAGLAEGASFAHGSSSYSISYVGGDGNDVVLTALYDAAAVAASSGTTAASEQVAVVVDSGITMSNADNAILASATVSITGGFHSGQDVLAFTNAGSATYGNIAASFNSLTGVLTLTSSGETATLAQWQSALRAVTYTDTSDAPDTAARTISFQANDGSVGGAISIKTVNVAAVNDAPSFAAGTGKVTTPIASSTDSRARRPGAGRRQDRGGGLQSQRLELRLRAGALQRGRFARHHVRRRRQGDTPVGSFGAAGH